MELKGSKTEANLQKAFAGESQARNKYTYFAEKAREEACTKKWQKMLEMKALQESLRKWKWLLK